MNALSTSSPPCHGQLCIWTDVDASHEADFNAWYDREHMQERVAIPGFLSARRFRATDGGPRRYLALYVTETLDVFNSAPYQRAFSAQTPWSLANFARMSGTQRRVGSLVSERGDGEGGQLAMFVVPASRLNADAIAKLDAQIQAGSDTPDIIAGRIFTTTPSLSVALRSDANDGNHADASANAAAALPDADALVLIEGCDAAAVKALAQSLAADIDISSDAVRTFALLWRIAA